MVLHVGSYRISLDMREPEANLNFVSHAHSDHTGGVKKNADILCSEITRDLVQARTKYPLRAVEIPDGVSLLSSGHMLGAKQLCAESESMGTIVYTGDYQMQKSPVAEEIEVRSADTLIIDSTYPFPNIVFENREEVMTSMQHYVRSKMDRGCTLFGSYSMGKAQELISICNGMGVSPLVDKNIAKISDVYSKHGVNLDYLCRGIEMGITDDDFREPVWIVSMHNMNKVRMHVSKMGRKIFTAVATGFAAMQRFNTDVQFALSDHADFKQALEYISMCSPKRIYTRGSGCDSFARNLRAHGYDAQTLGTGFGKNGVLMNYA
jgi:Cft2 family RNA processing exonuclease